MNKAQFESRYEFRAQLGEGGFGSVHKVWDREQRLFLAIKRAELPTHEFSLRREYELLRELPSHRNILHFNDYYLLDMGLGVKWNAC